MASTVAFAPPTAQQKACVPDHKRVARISKDIIRIDIDGEEPIFLTGHGICTAGSEQDINKIIKFRGATKRKAADGEAATTETKRAKADPEQEVSEQEDIDRAADIISLRQEHAQNQYWDDLSAPSKEEVVEPLPTRHPLYFEPEPEPVYDEDGFEIDQDAIVTAAVEALSAQAIAEAISGEGDSETEGDI